MRLFGKEISIMRRLMQMGDSSYQIIRLAML